MQGQSCEQQKSHYYDNDYQKSDFLTPKSTLLESNGLLLVLYRLFITGYVRLLQISNFFQELYHLFVSHGAPPFSFCQGRAFRVSTWAQYARIRSIGTKALRFKLRRYPPVAIHEA
jgi:hypothetical protein